MPDYHLAHYVHPKTALREGLARLLGKRREHEFSFAESGLRFLLADPLAEGVRALRQEVEERTGNA
jgi:hypothetical protein